MAQTLTDKLNKLKDEMVEKDIKMAKVLALNNTPQASMIKLKYANTKATYLTISNITGISDIIQKNGAYKFEIYVKYPIAKDTNIITISIAPTSTINNGETINTEYKRILDIIL